MEDTRPQILVVRDKVIGLKELVHDMDIPHPTIPEYVELHEKMQTIQKYIDEVILAEIFKMTY